MPTKFVKVYSTRQTVYSTIGRKNIKLTSKILESDLKESKALQNLKVLFN